MSKRKQKKNSWEKMQDDSSVYYVKKNCARICKEAHMHNMTCIPCNSSRLREEKQKSRPTASLKKMKKKLSLGLESMNCLQSDATSNSDTDELRFDPTKQYFALWGGNKKQSSLTLNSESFSILVPNSGLSTDVSIETALDNQKDSFEYYGLALGLFGIKVRGKSICDPFYSKYEDSSLHFHSNHSMNSPLSNTILSPKDFKLNPLNNNL